MKNKYTLVLFLIISNFNCFSLGINSKKINTITTKKWGEFLETPSRWSYGGVFGLNFIQDGLVFNFTPMVTFRAHNRVYLGASPGFSFIQQKIQYYNTNTQAYEKAKVQSTYYDYSLFLRWFAVGLTFIQIEPGYVNFKEITSYYFDPVADKFIINSQRKNIPYLQCGGGFVVPFAESKFFILRCMYDVLQNKESPYYGLPIIRGGINIGI